MKTMKNLIFVSVLGTLMIFASCKKETNDVVVNPITPTRPAADTIYYGTWVAQNSQYFISYKINKDSVWYSNYTTGIWTTPGLNWKIDLSKTPNVLFLNEKNGALYGDVVITQSPANNLMTLGDVVYQRQ